MRDREKAAVTGANGDEGAVVAGQAERAADGWVNEPAGAARDIDRERDSVEETSRNTDELPGAAVQGRELGVLSEPTGKQVDIAKLADELATSTWKRCRISGAKDGAGAERA